MPPLAAAVGGPAALAVIGFTGASAVVSGIQASREAKQKAAIAKFNQQVAQADGRIVDQYRRAVGNPFCALTHPSQGQNDEQNGGRDGHTQQRQDEQESPTPSPGDLAPNSSSTTGSVIHRVDSIIGYLTGKSSFQLPAPM